MQSRFTAKEKSSSGTHFSSLSPRCAWTTSQSCTAWTCLPMVFSSSSFGRSRAAPTSSSSRLATKTIPSTVFYSKNNKNRNDVIRFYFYSNVNNCVLYGEKQVFRRALFWSRSRKMKYDGRISVKLAHQSISQVFTYFFFTYILTNTISFLLLKQINMIT